MENLVSIVIPAYKEPYLNNTLKDLIDKAMTDIEIIPVIDGYELNGPLFQDKRIKPIFHKKNQGMRQAENAGIKKAIGKFLMKVDAHCCFDKGFDMKMAKECKKNWLLVPRRYSVKEDIWDRDIKRRRRDYHYVCFPQESQYGFSMWTADWKAREKERHMYRIDDTMSMQGSCWFANRDYFMDKVGLLDGRPEAYSGFAHEQLEVGMNYWLKGGEVKVIKNTWYAHLSKRKHHYLAGMFSRKYKKNSNTVRSHTWATKHWMNNEEPGIIHPFSWFIEKFWPVPTWPDNWQEKWESYGIQ